jgi:dipeptidyl aminopeptidase/acylaminoacyl peptidase
MEVNVSVSKITRLALLALTVAGITSSARAEDAYLKVAGEISGILDAPPPPAVVPSPNGDRVLIATAVRSPPIADLAEPFERLAGLRVDVANNAVHGEVYFTSLKLKKLPDGPETPVSIPGGMRASSFRWTVDGKAVAFMNTTKTAVELWLLDPATAKARRVPGIKLNPVLGPPITWLADQTTLLVRTVPGGRPPPPPKPKAPVAPYVQESSKVAKQSTTYESRDLLRTAHDAGLFDYFATSQLALVDTARGRVTPIGKPAIISRAAPSPDGLWDTKGAVVESLARLPLAEQVPIRGVRTGPREFHWRTTAPATLVWAEALDEGDLANKVPFRDRLMVKRTGQPATEWLKTEQRFHDIDFIEGGGLAIVRQYDDDRHWDRAEIHDADDPKVPPRVLWDRSSDEKYENPGEPVHRPLPNGVWPVLRHDDAIYLAGRGATPAGDRPFVDRLDLKTFAKRRLFRSEPAALETYIGFFKTSPFTFWTWRQTVTEPPNAWLRTVSVPVDGQVPEGEAAMKSTAVKLTSYTDPAPQLRAMKHKLVTYARTDRTQLSFKLYLPPGHKEGTRLPTVVWAYPLDYTAAKQAGQVEGSENTFSTMYGPTPLWFALRGYAVLYDAAMPVVGPMDTAYDTFVEQLSENARAAVKKAVELGVTDPDRVGIMGHSHGALMTATLLAHTDLFRAGIARSGAFNQTMRPFGFQKEHRTLFQAKDTYLKASPLLDAPKIDEPLLIIHGEIDANPGTVTLQSEKLFEAIRGSGGTARLVVLPLESHAYVARESVEHVIAEQLAWFDKYVKNAAPRAKQGSPGAAPAADGAGR